MKQSVQQRFGPRQSKDQAGRQSGFTLIEVMITVVILALLVGVAMPSYISSVKRSMRNEARAVLVENQLWMEQRFTMNGTYGDDSVVLPFVQSPKQGVKKYTIALEPGVTQSTYTMTAKPEADVDDLCGTFTIDQTGRKGLTGTHSMSVEECWAGK